MTTPSYATLTHTPVAQPRAGATATCARCWRFASVVNSLGLAAATLFVLVSSNLCFAGDVVRRPFVCRYLS